MQSKSSGPYKYRREGRSGWYGYVSRKQRHIPLGEDEKAADLKLAELVIAAAAEGKAAPKGKRLPIGAVFDACHDRAEANNTEETAYGLKIKLVHVGTWLESKGIEYPAQVSKDTIELFKAEHHRKSRRAVVKWAARSVNRYMSAWKKGMALAVEWGMVGREILDAFDFLPEPQVEPHQKGFTREQVDALLAAFQRDDYRSLARMIMGCGIRDAEAVHMDESNIGEGMITVTNKEDWTIKNYRNRRVPASPETLAAARRFVAAKPDMALDHKSIWTQLDRARLVAGLPRVSMHDLRRFWGSHLIAAGHSLPLVSKWFGHSSIQVTMRYLRIVEDDLPDAKTLPW